MSTHPLVRLLDKRVKRVVGLMSGTSLDGVDAAVVEVEGAGPQTRARLVAFRTTAYTPAERAAISALMRGGTAASWCAGNVELGERYARAAEEIIAEVGPVDLIGSHGQTIWHQPPSAGV
jgi:anhydro-N-acetylmuramic acid kinase